MRVSLDRVVTTSVLFFTLATLSVPLHAAKPVAAAPVAASGMLRCPGDPAGTCPIVEFHAGTQIGVPDGIRGDDFGGYVGDYLGGTKVGTWVDAHHAVHFVVQPEWFVGGSGPRFVVADFTNPASDNASLGTRVVKDGIIDVDRVTISSRNTETLGGTVCSLAVGQSALAQTWFRIGDDPEKWWTVFYDKPTYGGDYTTITRVDATTWTVRSTADQKARLYWRAKTKGSKDVDKGLYYMPLALTVTANCP